MISSSSTSDLFSGIFKNQVPGIVAIASGCLYWQKKGKRQGEKIDKRQRAFNPVAGDKQERGSGGRKFPKAPQIRQMAQCQPMPIESKSRAD
ncbi:hypothetical protein CEXT_578171 [Caerostris extrusa]|uniref:Uncharacterized protein n=1 Tax=Caerostris extrusa TaxID=172846 RepID=A0AAV4Y6N8_CAEEX|nr:hypothetical protein CEXT_578171 [Caerostris extrusa]